MVRNGKWSGTLVAMLVVLTACGTPSTSTTTGSGAASPSNQASNSAASSATGSSSGATASGSATASGGAVNVPVIVKAVTSDYWKTVCAGLEQATQADPSITTSCQGPNEESDVEGQIRIIEAAISSNPAAIAVAPSQADQVQPVLQRAIDAGIPIVLIDTDIPGFTAKTAFVGTDNQLGGQQAGEFIADQLGGTGNVAIIRGAAGDPVHNLREEGAKAALAAAGVTVVATQPANSDRAQGQSVAENLLTANPDLKAIYATNDEMALGAAQAAQAAGRSDLVIVGFDASPDALTAIEGDQMAGSIAQFPSKIGQLGLETAAKVARGQTVEQFVNTGVDLVTQENVAEFK